MCAVGIETSLYFELGPSVAEGRSTGGSLAEHRPIQKQGRVAFPTPSPTAPSAVWGTGAVDEAWKTHDRCRFGRGRFGSLTECQEHHQKLTPGDTKPTPSLIDGAALPGLSTLCPRRRSPANQVAVVKGWITPTTTSADACVQLLATPPGPNIAPFIRGGLGLCGPRRIGVECPPQRRIDIASNDCQPRP